MARLSSALILLVLFVNVATAHRFYKRDAAPRLCGTAFLDRSSAVLKAVDVIEYCNRRYRPEVDWYGLNPKSDNDMKEFCCKIGCDTEHFVEYSCMSKKSR